MGEAPGTDAWIEATSAFDRVRSIATTVSQPRSAAYIAEQAHVAENTARDHLGRLTDMAVLRARDEGGTTTYAPDPLYTRMQTLRDLLDQHDHDDLVEIKAQIQSQIDGMCEEYAVSSPTELRERAGEAEAASETRAIREAASDWELLQYRLGVIEEAIEHYADYTREDRVSV